MYLLLGACLWAAVVAYKPVVIVHGLFDSSGDFIHLQRFINEVSAVFRRHGEKMVMVSAAL